MLAQPESHRDWLKRVLRETGLAPSTLAKRAGVADTTLTRFLRSGAGQATLRADTIEKICAAMQVAPPGAAPAALRAEIAVVDERANLDILDHLQKAGPSTLAADGGWRQVLSSALELAGILPGDFIFVDLDRDPGPGDLVVAKIDDAAQLAPRLVIRCFEPPFLVSHSTSRLTRRPEHLYDDRVSIVGVISATVRLNTEPPATPVTPGDELLDTGAAA